jgi:hypothetical protein
MSILDNMDEEQTNVQLAKWAGYRVEPAMESSFGQQVLYSPEGEFISAGMSEDEAWSFAPYFLTDGDVAMTLIETHDYIITHKKGKSPTYSVELLHYVEGGVPKGYGDTLASAIIEAYAKWKEAQ